MRTTGQSSAGSKAGRYFRNKAVLFLGISLFVLGGIAVSQQASPAKFDAESRRTELLKYLNSVIQFYRNSVAPIQTIGEPNDVVYRDQAIKLSTQTTLLAFQSAKAEADLISHYVGKNSATQQVSVAEEQQRLLNAMNNADSRIKNLQARKEAVEKELVSAVPRKRKALQEQRDQLGAALDLATAMKDALSKIISISGQQGQVGLVGEIASLERSLPQLASKTLPSVPELASLDAARSSGVSSQTIALFQLLSIRHALDDLVQGADDLHQQAQELRAPITNLIRGLAARAQQLTQQATETPAPSQAQGATQAEGTAPQSGDDLKSITATFKAISSASIPLSQETILIEQSHANLMAWRSSVDREYKSILRSLLLRLLIIAIALGIIFAGGEIWSRTTKKYVREPRRLRQFLLIRRTVVGILSAIVILFGFVTQFNSLATFAGFITAGVAVGLQTILLSVAAYFFIIGRYGIKVGDRITILTATGAPVTGDVIEVGLVRFYMMELAGGTTELNPTGRVSVFSNAVLFQTGAPIYKQIPGTGYAWHELTVSFSEEADFKLASEEILQTVQSIYEDYRSAIEQQYRDVETWMHASIKSPEISSRLLFEDGSLCLWVRFPVQIKNAAETDEKLTTSLLQLMKENQQVKDAIRTLPVIRTAIKR